jgi:hypothetical protein
VESGGDTNPPLLGLTEAVAEFLVAAHWEAFARDGFLRLGPICTPEDADALRRCAGELGLDLIGDRIAEPELRPFLELMHHPLMHEICRRIYGARAPVMVARSEVAPGGHGAWCQTAAQLGELDREEVVTVVVALEAGAVVQAIGGSHLHGLVDTVPTDPSLDLPLAPGHALLLGRWLVHRLTGRTVSYRFVDGRARSVVTGYPVLPLLRGEIERTPYPCVRTLERECAALRERLAEALEYAGSLERERESR